MLHQNMVQCICTCISTHSKCHAIASKIEYKSIHTCTAEFQNKETFGTPIFHCMNVF